MNGIQGSARFILVGTGPFGVPAFRRLIGGRHAVVAVVTSPVKSAGPGVAEAAPVRKLALEHGLPILDPADINSSEARSRIAGLSPDLLVVCDYGQILSAETLATARLGGLNLHASLLPKYRGAAPIPWAIYHGETETGVSVIHMTPQVDAGPVIAQVATPIHPEETAGQLEQRLAELGASVLAEAVDRVIRGEAQPIPQDPRLASKAPRLKKTDGLIDWRRPAIAIKNQVRAMDPWPRACTFWFRDKSGPLRLILARVQALETGFEPAEPGTIVHVRERLVVAAGAAFVELLQIQPEGKRLMSAEEFLRGYRLRVGDRLGTPPQELAAKNSLGPSG